MGEVEPPGWLRLVSRNLEGYAVTGIDHIGIAVQSLDESLPLWRDSLGLEFQGIEEVPSEGVRVAFLQAGSTRIELLEPLHSTSPIARHLEKRGAGVHHIALRVADIRQKMTELATQGTPALDEKPRPGAHDCEVTFVHPKHAGGVLVELTQPRPDRST